MELVGKRYGRRDWRKLLGTRKGTMLVGLGCAALAATVLVVAMVRYRSSVDSTRGLATVLVATQPIPKNTSADAIATGKLFKPTQIASNQVTAGAIADTAHVHGEVLVRDVFPGEQLTAADFTANGGLAAQLPADHRAMTLTLDSQHGMVGQLHDGDHVDVYGGINQQSSLGRSDPVLRLLMRDVPVMKAASGSGAGGISATSGNTSQLTLDVSDSLAGALAYAADNGKVWLVLRPGNAVNTVPPSLITVQSFLLTTQPVAGGGGK
jgi:Flp pilus assembly protein CpaB